MTQYMENVRAKESILLILNPGITPEARGYIGRVFKHRIKLIQKTTFYAMENKFEEYLKSL